MNQSIEIVSIASGDPDLLNAKTLRAMKESRRLVLRTARSGIVAWLEDEKIGYSSLDSLYEAAEDFDQLASSIAGRLWEMAGQGPLVYAVPDPVTDRTVKSLSACRPAGANLSVVPGITLSDLYRAAVLPLLPDSDLRIASATDILSGDYDPNGAILITEIDNPILAGDVKLFLSEYMDDEAPVFYLQDPGGVPALIALFELDRQAEMNHLSAVWIPGSDYSGRNHFVLNDLLRIMERLRAPDGCPWDRVQTHQTLRPYLIEEAWECVSAIDGKETGHLADELGDLLFQIVFHASIGEAFDEFTIRDVINSICRKMIHRHPHVFASPGSSTPTTADWEKLKRAETGCKSVLESLNEVSNALPSLKYASKILKKLSLIPACKRDPAAILDEIRRAAGEAGPEGAGADEACIGRILFLYAELCQALNVDSELALHNAAAHSVKQIQAAEKLSLKDGKAIESLTFPELRVYLSRVEGESE